MSSGVKGTAWLASAAAVALLAGGCGDDDVTPGDAGPRWPDGGLVFPLPTYPDGQTIDVGPLPGAPWLDIGSGQYEFVPVDDAATVPLVFGCQGGQHIWIALRLRNMNPAHAIAELGLERARDHRAISIPFTVRITFETDPSGDHSDAWGMTLQAATVEEVMDEDVIVHAHVTDLDGVMATAAKPLHVVVGGSVCTTLDAGMTFDGDGGAGGDAGPDPVGDASTE